MSPKLINVFPKVGRRIFSEDWLTSPRAGSNNATSIWPTVALFCHSILSTSMAGDSTFNGAILELSKLSWPGCQLQSLAILFRHQPLGLIFPNIYQYNHNFFSHHMDIHCDFNSRGLYNSRPVYLGYNQQGQVLQPGLVQVTPIAYMMSWLMFCW